MTTIKRRWYTLAAFVFSCGSPAAPDFTWPMSPTLIIEGYVTAIEPDRYPSPRILIEEQPHAGSGILINPHEHGRKFFFSIWPETTFERVSNDGSVSVIRMADLVVGDRARGWAGSIIVDTYPGRTAAARIQVVPE